MSVRISRRFVTAWLGLWLLAVACAQPVVTPRPDLVWPVPPDPPRIRHVMSLASPADLRVPRSIFRRVADFLFGAEDVPVMLRPYGVASDGRGHLVVTDLGLQVVHLFDLDRGRYSQLFRLDADRQLLSPIGVAWAPNGRLYVSDSVLNKIFLFSPRGQFLGAFGEFQRVAGLAFHPPSGRLYAADTLGHRVAIFDAHGTPLGSFGRRGSEPGAFNFPTHVAVDQAGRVYVTDTLNFRVQVFDGEGRPLLQVGRLGTTIGTFSKPKGVGVDRHGHLYVVDSLYDTVQIFDIVDGRSRLLLHLGQTGVGAGQFWLPAGIAVDGRDRIYVADTYNQRVQVFELLPEPASPQRAPLRGEDTGESR